MNKKIIIIAAMIAGACLFLTGCHPKRIVWTADGKQAVVWNDHGLFFADAEGNISRNMYAGVVRAEWFPDGQRLVVEKDICVRRWDEVEEQFPQKYRDEILHYAKALLQVKTKKEWETKIKTLQDLNLISDNDLDGIKIYLRDRALDNYSSEMAGFLDDYYEFHCYSVQVAVWKNEEFSVKKTLFTSGQRVWDFRFSGKGRILAFTTAHPGDFQEGTASSLWAADTTTGKVELLDKNTALYPDWDTAGMTLYYVRSIGKESTDNPLGTLLKRQICDSEGAMLDVFAEPDALAGLVANEFTKVRCLKDGRIIFSSMEVTLPVIGKDIPEQKQLFVLDPQRQSTITRLIPRSALSRTEGYNFDFFEISPDEKVISIPDDDGRVAALMMATGDFTVLQGQGTEEIQTVPVWRYPNELCYIDEARNGLLGDKKSKQMMLRQVTPGGEWSDPRVISKSWSKEARKVILD